MHTADRGKADISLPAANECPTWLMPNAGGAGYYRWNLNDAGMKALRGVFNTTLNAQERISVVDSLTAGINNGSTTPGTLIDMLPEIVAAKERTVVTSPLGTYRKILSKLLDADLREIARSHADGIWSHALPHWTSLVARNQRLKQPCCAVISSIFWRWMCVPQLCAMI